MRPLVAGFPRRWHGSIHVEFVVGGVALGQFLPRVLRFSSHIHSYIIWGVDSRPDEVHFRTDRFTQSLKNRLLMRRPSRGWPTSTNSEVMIETYFSLFYFPTSTSKFQFFWSSIDYFEGFSIAYFGFLLFILYIYLELSMDEFF